MVSIRNVRLAFVVGLTIGQAFGSTLTAADDAGVVSRLAGRWVYAGEEQERQARLDAIEATVSQMAWIARGMARKRITASTVIHQQYVISVEGGLVTIAEDDFKGHTVPWDGTNVEIPRDQGGPATLTRSAQDGGLRSHWKQKRGAGTEIYRVSEDGDSMVVTVIVSSPRLPSDVRYDLTYRRQE